jgi:hypothetical protein
MNDSDVGIELTKLQERLDDYQELTSHNMPQLSGFSREEWAVAARQTSASDAVLDAMVYSVLASYQDSSPSQRRRIEHFFSASSKAGEYLYYWIIRTGAKSFGDLNLLLNGVILLSPSLSPGDTVCILGGIYRKGRSANFHNVLEAFREVGAVALEDGLEEIGRALLNFEKSEVFRIAKGFYD